MARYITLLSTGVFALTLSSTVLARRDEVLVAGPYKAQAALETAKTYERAAGLKAMAEHYRQVAQAYARPDAKPWMATLVAHYNSMADRLEKAARDALAIAEGHAKAENAK